MKNRMLKGVHDVSGPLFFAMGSFFSQFKRSMCPIIFSAVCKSEAIGMVLSGTD